MVISWDAVSTAGLALCLVAVAWNAGTMIAAMVQPLKRRHVAAPRVLPSVSVIVPVSGNAPALTACAESLGRLTYPRHEVMLCASEDDGEATLAIQAALKLVPGMRGCIVTPIAISNPKAALVAAALPLAKHDLILFSDDNVVSSPERIQTHLAYRGAGYGLVSACVVGDEFKSFWAAVDGAFMNGHFARLQRAGDAVGLSFSTGKSILLSRNALTRSGGYKAAGETICEDAIVQRDLCAIGERVTLTHEVQRQPIGQRRAAEVWHRHLRWARCRRRHAPLLFALEAATSGPITVLAAAIAGSAISLPYACGAAGALLLLSMEWGFLVFVGWPRSRWYPAVWVTRELMALALWVTALKSSEQTLWRGKSLKLRS